MYRRLHIQLTFFCCLVITLILAVMSFFYIRLARQNMTASQFSDFQQDMNDILQEIDEQSCISHTWLNRLTSKYGLHISIRDNGIPLLYQASHQKEESCLLAAIDTAVTEYSFSADNARGHDYTSHIEFQNDAITGTNTFFSVAYIPKEAGVLTVSSMLFPANDSGFTRNVTVPLLLFTAIAILILSIFSYFLIGLLIKPLIASHEKQVEFFSSASHELRSPLAVITASLSAVETAADSKKPALLAAARRECGRMKQLINDMFTLACLDHGSLSLHQEKTQLENLVIETYEKFLPVFSEKNIHVLFRLPDSLLPSSRCDPERISQLFSILMDNAGAYTPSEGQVEISLALERNHFIFAVADNGPGIPDSEKEHIFRRFYRCDKSRTDKNHFGLGLGIAKEIATLHHGSVQVKDTPGGGATFLVTLPVTK